MTATINVIGDMIYYDGHLVGTVSVLEGTTAHMEFCDAIQNIKSEKEYEDDVAQASEGSFKEGQNDILTKFRYATEKLQNRLIFENAISNIEELIAKLRTAHENEIEKYGDILDEIDEGLAE